MWTVAAGILTGAALLAAAQGYFDQVAEVPKEQSDSQQRRLPSPEEGGVKGKSEWQAQLWKEASKGAGIAQRWGRNIK